MRKIKKGDIVQIVKGKDRGKKGKVLEFSAGGRRIIVEGLNLVKKHKKQRRQDEKGGIIAIEAPLDVSNAMFFCKSCNKPARLGFSFLKDKTKSRVCRKCKEAV